MVADAVATRPARSAQTIANSVGRGASAAVKVKVPARSAIRLGVIVPPLAEQVYGGTPPVIAKICDCPVTSAAALGRIATSVRSTTIAALACAPAASTTVKTCAP